jgi:hypothetical protein
MLLAAALAVTLAIVLVAVVAERNRSRDSADRDSRLEMLGITWPEGSFRMWVNSYPEGAEVLIDDSLGGKTPLAFDTLEGGEHTLGLRLAGFADIDTVVSLLSGQHLTLPPFILQRKIRLESVPPGADVAINGRTISERTPCELEWPIVDTFTLEYFLSGFEPVWMSDVDLASGTEIVPIGDYWVIEDDTVSRQIRLIGYFARRVTINTVPTGAQVLTADGDSVIGTSGELLNLPCGEWVYTLRKPGFNERRLRVNIDADASASYRCELTRDLFVTAFEFGQSPDFDIHASIVKADKGVKVVFLDETTPAVLELPGTEHRVYFEAEHYADTSVIIAAGQLSLSVGMRRISETTGEVPVRNGDSLTTKGRVEFYLYDRRTEKALEGAEVIARIEREERTVLLGVTDSSGLLTQDLYAGRYEFRFLAEGYRSSRKKHVVRLGEAKRLEVPMKRE